LIWQTKQSFARIAIRNSFLLKGNKLSTKKKALKTNPKDARNAEKLENSKEMQIAAAITDGKKKRELSSLFLCQKEQTCSPILQIKKAV
jgi:uncharacterized membrane protein